MIAHLPERLRREVRAWLVGSFLYHKLGGPVAREAVHLKQARIDGSGPEADHRRVCLHAHLIRVLCRGLDPTLPAYEEKGNRGRLIDRLGVRVCLQRPAGRVSISHRSRIGPSIGRSMQVRERTQGFKDLSAFGAGAWAYLDCGWELREYADRQRWRVERAESLARQAALRRGVAAALPLHADPTGTEDKDVLKYDPLNMRRSWEKWE